MFARIRWTFWAVMLLAVVMSAGCWMFGGAVKLPDNVSTVYPRRPDGSRASIGAQRATDTRTFAYTFDEVFDAAYKAAFNRGLNVEKEADTGRVFGKGQWNMVCAGGPCQMHFTFVIYIEEMDKSPKTKITVIMDRFNGTGPGLVARADPREFVTELIGDVQKLLAST